MMRRALLLVLPIACSCTSNLRSCFVFPSIGGKGKRLQIGNDFAIVHSNLWFQTEHLRKRKCGSLLHGQRNEDEKDGPVSSQDFVDVLLDALLTKIGFAGFETRALYMLPLAVSLFQKDFLFPTLFVAFIILSRSAAAPDGLAVAAALLAAGALGDRAPLGGGGGGGGGGVPAAGNLQAAYTYDGPGLAGPLLLLTLGAAAAAPGLWGPGGVGRVTLELAAGGAAGGLAALLTPENMARHKLRDLKALAAELGLKVSGTKAELAERLLGWAVETAQAARGAEGAAALARAAAAAGVGGALLLHVQLALAAWTSEERGTPMVVKALPSEFASLMAWLAETESNDQISLGYARELLMQSIEISEKDAEELVTWDSKFKQNTTKKTI